MGVCIPGYQSRITVLCRRYCFRCYVLSYLDFLNVYVHSVACPLSLELFVYVIVRTKVWHEVLPTGRDPRTRNLRSAHLWPNLWAAVPRLGAAPRSVPKLDLGQGLLDPCHGLRQS